MNTETRVLIRIAQFFITKLLITMSIRSLGRHLAKKYPLDAEDFGN